MTILSIRKRYSKKVRTVRTKVLLFVVQFLTSWPNLTYLHGCRRVVSLVYKLAKNHFGFCIRVDRFEDFAERTTKDAAKYGKHSRTTFGELRDVL